MDIGPYPNPILSNFSSCSYIMWRPILKCYWSVIEVLLKSYWSLIEVFSLSLCLEQAEVNTFIEVLLKSYWSLIYLHQTFLELVPFLFLAEKQKAALFWHHRELWKVLLVQFVVCLQNNETFLLHCKRDCSQASFNKCCPENTRNGHQTKNRKGPFMYYVIKIWGFLNGIKTINSHRYPVMIFSKNCFQCKKINKKIGCFFEFRIFMAIYIFKTGLIYLYILP